MIYLDQFHPLCYSFFFPAFLPPPLLLTVFSEFHYAIFMYIMYFYHIFSPSPICFLLSSPIGLIQTVPLLQSCHITFIFSFIFWSWTHDSPASSSSLCWFSVYTTTTGYFLHMNENRWYLSFWAWLILLNMMISVPYIFLQTTYLDSSLWLTLYFVDVLHFF
jgi:hypothetical protein